MWLMTTSGFYSITRSDRDKEVWMVRARHAQDLENLKKLAGLRCKTIKSENTDYPFRILIGKDQFYRITTALTGTVDYPNFKSEVAKRPDQRNKVSAYHKIWGALLETQVVKSLYSWKAARAQDVDEGWAQPGLWNHGRELARRGPATEQSVAWARNNWNGPISLQDAIELHDGPIAAEDFPASDQALWDDIEAQEPGYTEVGNY